MESDRGRLPRIRAVRVDIESVRAKMKYGGNWNRTPRATIAAHLAERGGPLDLAAREHLLRRLPDA